MGSRLISTFCGFNGLMIAPNRIQVNIIPAKMSIPIFQPSLSIMKFANGPNERTPIPVPAVTRPKHRKSRLKENPPLIMHGSYHWQWHVSYRNRMKPLPPI